ncbi:MAG: nodulation protein NfeD [Thermoleophilia bacterium]|nr:nodulation protein NfeD [Thermoleophilia bacterium]
MPTLHYILRPRPGRSRSRLVLALLVIGLGAALLFAAAHDSATALAGPVHADNALPVVLEAPLNGTIDPVTKDWVERVLKRGERDNVDAVVFTMDTPGGLQTSMDDIVKQFLAEKDFPVFVYVAPDGARAASAGAYIALASDVIGMAPSTNIGSATPINGNGKNVGSDLRRKVINDAVAKATALARTHGRDEKFAEDMIRKAENLRADQALERHIIEYIAPSLNKLLDDADGSTTKPKGLVVHVKDASVIHLKFPWTLAILHTLIDPNVLYLLFSAGLLGLAFEITHPGIILPGVAGATCLVIALYGFQVLPTSAAGLVLLALGGAFMLAEVFVPSHGVLGMGGATCLAIGGLLLFDRDSVFAVNWGVIAGTTVVFGGFFGFLVRKIVAVRRQPPRTGRQLMLGSLAPVRQPVSTTGGSVFAEGDIWRARTVAGPEIPAGTQVQIVAIDGLTLLVEPVPDAMSAGLAGTDPDSEKPTTPTQETP